MDRRRLAAPEQTLRRLAGLIVIDEVQRSPALLETVRVLADRPHNPARFLLLGSASPTLIAGVSESLAGRVGLVDRSGRAGYDNGQHGDDARRYQIRVVRPAIEELRGEGQRPLREDHRLVG